MGYWERQGLGALPPWLGDVVGWGRCGGEGAGPGGGGLEHLEEKGWALSQSASEPYPDAHMLQVTVSHAPRLK